MLRSDANQDGKISRSEFQGPDDLFVRLDFNKDGFVTVDEARGMRERMATPMSPANRGGGSMMLRQRLDGNRDDRVSLQEWTEFFQKADENGDDMLQAEEWEAAMRGEPLKDPAPAVGAPAPEVRAKTLQGGREVDLSSPTRLTVLVFGSYT